MAEPNGRLAVDRSPWPAIGRVLKQNWYLLAAAVALVVGTSLIELAPPLILKDLVDNKLTAGVADGILRLAILYLGATAASRAIQFGLSCTVAVLGQNMLYEIRMLVARRFELLPQAYFDRTPVGEVMSRCTNDVDAVNTLFSSGMMNVTTDLFRIAGVLGAMFIIDWRLTVVVILSAPLVAVTTEFFRRNVRDFQRQLRVLTANIYAFLQEAWSGMRVVRAYGAQGEVGRKLDGLQETYIRSADGASLYNAYFPGVLKAIEALTVAVVVWYGARPAVLAAGLTLGGLVALAQLVVRLHTPLQNIGQEWQAIQEGLTGLERISEFLAEPVDEGELEAKAGEDEAETSSATEVAEARRGARVAARGLTFGYFPGRPVISGLDLSISPGDRVVVVGRTGAGKTSLLHLLAGLYKPWEGAVAIDGLEPGSLPPVERRRLLGVVPQAVHIFDASVHDNISLLDPGLDRAQVEAACRAVGLHETVLALPEGYDTRLEDGGPHLSFGQSQLLCLARALVHDPPLLLLDEPTSGTDTETEAEIFRALRVAGRSRTVITIAHRLTGIIDAERVIVLSGGRVVQDGSPEELAGKTGWYKVFRELEELGWENGA